MPSLNQLSESNVFFLSHEFVQGDVILFVFRILTSPALVFTSRSGTCI